MTYCTECRRHTPAVISTVFRAQRESQRGGNAKQGWARHLHHHHPHHHHWWGWEGCMRGCHSGAVCSSCVITFWVFLAIYFWLEWARAIRRAIVRILGGALLGALRASLRRHGNRSPRRQPTLTHRSQPLGLWWKRSRARRRRRGAARIGGRTPNARTRIPFGSIPCMPQ